jgi:hypothetical protein
MPRDFAKVRSRFWNGPTGKKIRASGRDAQVVGMYLLTCGNSNMIGLYYLPLQLISHETGIPLEGASEALRRLSEAHFAYYDDTEEVVFVPRMAAEQIDEQLQANDKRCAGIARELKDYEKSRFYPAFVFIYRKAFHLPESMGLGSPLEGASEGLRSQEQEQENEKEQPPRARDPGAMDSVVQAQPQPLPDEPLIPDTPERLQWCLKTSMERVRPELGMYNPGPFADRDARDLMNSLGDPKVAAQEVMRRIEIFANDDRMSPWTVRKFCQQYNGIGTSRRPPGGGPVVAEKGW